MYSFLQIRDLRKAFLNNLAQVKSSFHQFLLSINWNTEEMRKETSSQAGTTTLSSFGPGTQPTPDT